MIRIKIQGQEPPCVELEEGGEPTLFIPDAQVLQNKLINISNIPDAQVTVKQINFTTKSDGQVLHQQNKVLIFSYLKSLPTSVALNWSMVGGLGGHF